MAVHERLQEVYDAAKADAAADAAAKAAAAAESVKGAPTAPTTANLQQQLTSMQASVKGGARRPYRVFKNVGATAKGADMISSGAAEITDPFGEGLKYAIRSVSIKTITQATLGSAVISLGTNTAADNVFSKTIVLAGLPAVGNTLELLGLAGTTLPADVTLPATIQAKASSGTFEIIIDGLLK